jgi:predicted ATP-binding protein involved in virulence
MQGTPTAHILQEYTMKIVRISVRKLFGVFDHDVPLNDGGITIVIGENGLGKTVLLEAAYAFFAENFLFFRDLDFYQLIFQFEDQWWEVSKSQTADRLTISVTRHFRYFAATYAKTKSYKPEKIAEIELSEQSSPRSRHDFIRRMPLLERLGGDNSSDEQSMLEYKLALMQMYLIDDDFRFSRPKMYESPAWFKDAIKRISIRLIETQRIITAKERGGESYVSRVTQSAKELSEQIAEIDKVASQTATKLDGTFPNRLVRKLRHGTTDSFDELNAALSELYDRRKKLSSIGLLEVTSDTDILRVDESQGDLRSALKLYIDDSHKKLSPYSAIASKLELFKRIVNKRFKHKALEVDRKSGFVFRSTVKHDEHGKLEAIPPVKLSSGEQNELILFYELIFKSSKGDLIFIDEPEISLHISWQNKFIDDLKEITSISKVSIVIATHSPDIIGENWDLKVELKGIE